MGLTLERLPDEIVQNILSFLQPKSITAVLETSTRLNRIANEPALWRHYCLRDFQRWDETHRIHHIRAAGLSSTNWQLLYRRRVLTDRTTTKILNSILATQQSRVAKFQEIVDQGYDTKDTLLRHLQVGDDAEDVLARRYFSKAVLGHLHRTMAVKEWIKVQQGGSSLERALVAFDMFVIQESEGDFDTLARQLDDLAKAFQEENGPEGRTSTRVKTLALAKFVRAHNLTGLDSDIRFRNLENSFIGVALKSRRHSSLPLISVAIFCALAERLGLDARPCGFPEHVHAMVYPPKGLNLDGESESDHNEAKPMYLDPFNSDEEVPIEDLRERLKQLPIPSNSHDEYLGPASVMDMVMRTARNIWQSVRESRRRFGGPDGDNSSYSLDHESAFYGAMFALLVLGYDDDLGLIRTGVQPTQIILYMIHILETHFPDDVSLVERYAIPLFEGMLECRQLVEAVRIASRADEAPKVPHPRGDHLQRRVKYRIGQLFQHRRYGYTAVIIGWDASCEAGEDWIQVMDVDALPHGRNQSFYHVLVDDRTARYVAEENIEITHQPEPPPKILPGAGRYFKRWDKASGTFISNIRDEYPDD